MKNGPAAYFISALFQRSLHLPAGNTPLFLIGERRHARVQKNFAAFGISGIDNIILSDKAFHFSGKNIRILAAFGKALRYDKTAVQLTFPGGLVEQITLVVNDLEKFKYAFGKERLVASCSAEQINLVYCADRFGFHAAFLHFQLAGF